MGNRDGFITKLMMLTLHDPAHAQAPSKALKLILYAMSIHIIHILVELKRLSESLYAVSFLN